MSDFKFYTHESPDVQFCSYCHSRSVILDIPTYEYHCWKCGKVKTNPKEDKYRIYKPTTAADKE